MTATAVKEQLTAMRRATKTAARSQKSARALLVRAGILSKGGKKLAKPYR